MQINESRTFNDIDNAVLYLPPNVFPYRRLLNWHGRCAFKTAKANKWIDGDEHLDDFFYLSDLITFITRWWCWSIKTSWFFLLLFLYHIKIEKIVKKMLVIGESMSFFFICFCIKKNNWNKKNENSKWRKSKPNEVLVKSVFNHLFSPRKKYSIE